MTGATSISDLLVSAFGGAALALIAQAVWLRAQRVATARTLAVAFWEELSAVQFSTAPVLQGSVPQIGGFSSQTFDTLFGELARTLPRALARDLMRYHWRMKLLKAQQAASPVLLAHNVKFYQEAQSAHADLLARLDRYGRRWIPTLMVWSGEVGR